MQIPAFNLSTQFPTFFAHASRALENSSIFFKTTFRSITDVFRPLSGRATTLSPYLKGTAFAVVSLTAIYFYIQARKNETTLKNEFALRKENDELKTSKSDLERLNNKLATEKNELETEKATFKKNLGTLNTTYQSVLTQLRATNQELTDAKAKIEELEKSKNELMALKRRSTPASPFDDASSTHSSKPPRLPTTPVPTRGLSKRSLSFGDTSPSRLPITSKVAPQE